MAGPVRDFRGTDDGEWDTSGGDFSVVAGAEAVPQGIRVRARMFLGECYLDEEVGVDYLGSILVKNPDPLVVRALLHSAIARTPDVVGVSGTDLLIDDRDATIAYEVDTAYSEQPFSGTVGVP